MALKQLIRLGLIGLAMSVATTVGVNVPTLAQQDIYDSDGLNIIGGVESRYRLSYSLDNNSPRNTRASYLLEVKGDKVDSAVSALIVTVPEAFSRYRGRIDLDRIKVRYGRIGNVGEEIAIEEVLWDDRVFSGANDLSEDLDKLEIYLAEDIPANTSFVIDFEKVRNPNRALMQRVNLQVVPRGEELATYIGTWEMLIAYQD
ncbi:DUF2808 domain-containing protein [Leptolyngbya sp. Heron Island J]|uniref:DUF2808 domain-containing protein n=1 Tax=Leptolyngbya sp. Heron Island J TaxID=1385935 RepID=UPI0003F8A1C9|nr:DUF2808 domain-containing protein [Leptolyngbya sp. Heron Island J]